MLAIKAESLTKIFGKLTAVNNLNLEVEEGCSFGFLGPNGAGKTTTIKMLCGFLSPTKGTVKIFGHEVNSQSKMAKLQLGLVPDYYGLYEDMTPQAHLEYYSSLYGVPLNERVNRVEELLDFVNLKERKNSKVREFSRGMRQRLVIAQALIHKPKLLLLDEPLEGLDPAGQYEIKQLIRELTKSGELTIFISSHRLYEVDELCTDVGIINKGNMIRVDKIKNLQRDLQKLEGGAIIEITLTQISDEILDSVKKLDGVRVAEFADEILKVRAETSEIIPQITETIVKSGGKIKGINEKIPSLEEIYLELVR
ncbi:MAG: ABC transporter ATP-binding protein [Candidatus Thermoplasmatota archaeon]